MADGKLGIATAFAIALTTTGAVAQATPAHQRPAASIGDVLTGEQGAAPQDVAPEGMPADARMPVAPGARRVQPPRPAVARAPRAPATDLYPVDLLISLANDAVYSDEPFPRGQQSDPRMIKLQVLLDRNHASPGVIDGINGGNVAKAIAAYEMMIGHPVDGVMDAELWDALQATSDEPVLVSYEITDKDVEGPFVPVLPADYAEQALLPAAGYRDPVEMLAERFHMDEAFLRRLNPGADFFAAGSFIVVANPGKPEKTKVASIIADKGRKQLLGYDVNGRLVVAYPATIGSADLPSPTGVHAVKAIAVNPDYWYRPKVNFQQGENSKALKLPPGPNAPVGSVWIGLDKPTYGLHGTPEPSKIDKTNSHGCVRMTNWDANELAHLVAPGVTVDFREPDMPAASNADVAEFSTGAVPR